MQRQASTSALKRQAKNTRIVLTNLAASLLVNAIFIGWRLYRNRASASWLHWASLVPTTLTYAVSFQLLATQAREGLELFQKGIVEYLWDMVWVTMFVQLSACYTEWAWALYAIPPTIGVAYGSYMLWTSVVYPWISRVDGPVEDGDATAKRRAKADRQMRRQKGK